MRTENGFRDISTDASLDIYTFFPAVEKKTVTKNIPEGVCYLAVYTISYAPTRGERWRAASTAPSYYVSFPDHQASGLCTRRFLQFKAFVSLRSPLAGQIDSRVYNSPARVTLACAD